MTYTEEQFQSVLDERKEIAEQPKNGAMPHCSCNYPQDFSPIALGKTLNKTVFGHAICICQAKNWLTRKGIGAS